jgi:hypothetical protein
VIQLINRKLTEQFSKAEMQMVNKYMNKAQHPSPRMDCKSKQHSDSISTRQEWKLLRKQTANIGEDGEKRNSSTLLVGM